MTATPRPRCLLSFAALLTLCLALAAMPVAAQGGMQPPMAAPAPQPRSVNTALTVHPLSPRVFWVEGGVGNVGVIVGDDGVVLVDTTSSPISATVLLAEIAKITPKPVTTVILTHGDGDHVGGLAAFPVGIRIIAQDHTRQSLASPEVVAGRGPIPADRLPTHTVNRREDLMVHGVAIRLLHWSAAHTAGDLIVDLPADRIAFTGDVFTLDQPRALIHREQGGTASGWMTTARAIVALKADRFVVAHGDVQGKAALRERIAQSAMERQQVIALAARGWPLARIQDAVSDPPAGSAAPHFPPFSEIVFKEMSDGRAADRK